MTTKFVSDSSCDMQSFEGVNFSSVPLSITTDEINYIDDETLDVNNMIDYLAGYKGRSYTACPSIESWLNSFGGADRIYVVAMTSTLSGTYNSAMTAKEMYLQEHPDTEIYVFDTLTTGPEQRLLIEKLIELDNSEDSFETIINKAKEYLAKTRLFFALKSLHNFAQNGSISKAIASAVGILGISIFATASDEGDVAPISKCRSEKKVLASLLNHIETAGYKGGKLRISHVDNLSLASKVKDAVLEKYPKADILVYAARGLCSYYAEKGGILVGCEC